MELLKAAADGRGALVLLTGEAEVAKSRRAEEAMRASLDADFQGFSGRPAHEFDCFAGTASRGRNRDK